MSAPLSEQDREEGRLIDAYALRLCESFEDDDGGGCEPEEPPCIGHVQEAIESLERIVARHEAEALRAAADAWEVDVRGGIIGGTQGWLRARAASVEAQGGAE